MIDDLPNVSLLLKSLGRCLLLSGSGIAIAGAVYMAAAVLLSVRRKRSNSPAIEDRTLWSACEPIALSEAWCRAGALAVTATVVVIGTPWIHRFVGDLISPWNASYEGQQPWHYGLLAVIVWLGFLPFALFVWRLPHRAFQRSMRSATEQSMRRHRSPIRADSNGLDGDFLRDRRPYTEPVQRACRRYAAGIALCAPMACDSQPAHVARRPPSMDVVLLLPIVVALFLSATVNVWLVIACVAALGAWVWVALEMTYRSAVAAPGSVIADYLLLSSYSADKLPEWASIAETYLDPNPAMLQDHEGLVAAVSGAVRIKSVPWNPVNVDTSNLEMETRLWAADYFGNEQEINIRFHMRRQQGEPWRITRELIQDSSDPVVHSAEHHFAVASAWRPR